MLLMLQSSTFILIQSLNSPLFAKFSLFVLFVTIVKKMLLMMVRKQNHFRFITISFEFCLFAKNQKKKIGDYIRMEKETKVNKIIKK